MKDKRYQLKPALAICGIMAVIVVVLFVMAGYVNQNVVKNMKGRILYDSVSKDGKKAVVMYDFGSGTLTGISDMAGCAEAGCDCAGGAVFAGDNEVAFIADYGDRSEVYIYDLAAKKVTAKTVSENIEYTALNYSGKTGRLVCACRDGDMWYIKELTAEGTILREKEISALDDKIYSLCFDKSGDMLYFVQNKGDCGVLKSVKADGSGNFILYESEKALLTGVEVFEDTLLLCEKDKSGRGIALFNAKRKTTSRTKFDSDKYDCAAVAAVSKTQYIVSSNAAGSYGIYVCNGSNMVLVDATDSDNDLIISDYQPE